MKVVIDIPEEDYKDLMNEEWISALNDYQLMIRNGKPLPKGHGDLIDRDFVVNILEREVEYAEDLARHRTLNYILDVVIDGAKTVIPADK